MSFRSLNQAIALNGSSVSVNGPSISIAGQYGSISYNLPKGIDKIETNQNMLHFLKSDQIDYEDRKYIGTFISLLKSGIFGVNNMHETRVVFKGTGVFIEVVEGKINRKIGKSHVVTRHIPEYLQCEVISSDVKRSILSVKGIDKGKVSMFASEFRVKRSYKGGIHVFIEGKEPRLKEKKGA